MAAIIAGLLVIGLEFLLVRTGPRIDLCKDEAIRGPGEFMLVTLVYLAILLIVMGIISAALKVFNEDRSLWIVLSSFGILASLSLAFFLGTSLNMQDCGLTAY